MILDGKSVSSGQILREGITHGPAGNSVCSPGVPGLLAKGSSGGIMRPQPKNFERTQGESIDSRNIMGYNYPAIMMKVWLVTKQTRVPKGPLAKCVSDFHPCCESWWRQCQRKVFLACVANIAYQRLLGYVSPGIQLLFLCEFLGSLSIGLVDFWIYDVMQKEKSV